MQTTLEQTTPYLFFILRIIPESKTSWSFRKAADTQRFSLRGTVKGQESLYYPGKTERIWTHAGTFNELSKVQLTNSVITGPILRLSKYCFPPSWVNLKDCIFLKKINQLLVVFYLNLLLFSFFFFENIFGERHFQDSRN